MKQTTRFTHPNGSTLDVRARTGKTGISVFVSVRKPGERAVNGARSLYDPTKETEAKLKFDALVTDAKAKGWQPKSSSIGVSKFTEVPSPNAMPSGSPVAAKTAPAKAKGKK